MSTEKPFAGDLRVLFHSPAHILWEMRKKKGGAHMRQTDDPNADLEDLIYDEDAPTHSDR